MQIFEYSSFNFWIWWPSEVLTLELEDRTGGFLAKLDILLQNFQTALEKLNIRRKHSIFFVNGHT
tara:strand:+ start:103 stop:297 length:195 start_codon:yes stop_codon:yes gene_type:complete